MRLQTEGDVIVHRVPHMLDLTALFKGELHRVSCLLSCAWNLSIRYHLTRTFKLKLAVSLPQTRPYLLSPSGVAAPDGPPVHSLASGSTQGVQALGKVE